MIWLDCNGGNAIFMNKLLNYFLEFVFIIDGLNGTILIILWKHIHEMVFLKQSDLDFVAFQNAINHFVFYI